MEDLSHNFSTIAGNLQRDAEYWKQVGSQISSGRPLQVDNEGNLTSSGWGWGWGRTQKTPTETINLFATRFLESTNQTLNDLTKIHLLLDRVSYAENQEAHKA